MEDVNVPSVLAILLADYVITEGGSQKKTVVGIIDGLWGVSAPIHHRVAFFARLTDMEGIYKFTIRVVRMTPDSEELVAGGELPEASITDRLGIVDIALNLPPTRFPEFGKYEFQLFANSVFLGRAVLNVNKKEG